MRLADSKAEAYAAKCMVLDAARQKDLGYKITTEASCCKLFATEMVGRVADKAVQIHGGYGFVKEYHVERLMRDAKITQIYEGTSEIQQIVISRGVLKD